jgi:hypothetical protein
MDSKPDVEYNGEKQPRARQKWYLRIAIPPGLILLIARFLGKGTIDWIVTTGFAIQAVF